MERIYVGNLPQDVVILDIDHIFRPFGKLVAVDMKNSNPPSAFIQFDNPRSAFNAVQARNGYKFEGCSIQVRLVSNAEPPVEGRRSNSSNYNNGNLIDNWDKRYNSGDNNYQGNNMIQYPSIQRLAGGMNAHVGGGRDRDRIDDDPFNTPIVQYPINAGYTGDQYLYGLSGCGVKWFKRYLSDGYSREKAREKAFEHRKLPHLRGTSAGGKTSSYMNNNCSGCDEFDMLRTDRRSFGDDFFGGGFSNNQPSMINFSSENNSNLISGSILQNQSSYIDDGFDRRTALADKYAAGPRNRLRRQERVERRAKDTTRMHEKVYKGISKGEYEHALYMIKRIDLRNGKKSLNSAHAKEKREFERIVAEYKRRMKNIEECRKTILGAKKSVKRDNKKDGKKDDKKADIKDIKKDDKKDVSKEYSLEELNAIKDKLMAKAKEYCAKPNGIQHGGAAVKRYNILYSHGLSANDAKYLSILKLNQLSLLLKFPKSLFIANRKKNITAKNDDETTKKPTITEAMKVNYEKALTLLRKYEDKNIDGLSDREKAFIRISLRRKLKYEEETGSKGTPSKLEVLLEEELPTNDDEEDPQQKKEDGEEEEENNEDQEQEDANNSVIIDEEVDELIGEIGDVIVEDDDDQQMLDSDEEICDQQEIFTCENEEEDIACEQIDEEFINGCEEYNNEDEGDCNNETA